MQHLHKFGIGSALTVAFLSCIGSASAQNTVSRSYTSVDAYGNRTTTTIEAPVGAGLQASTVVSPYAVAQGYGWAPNPYPYGYPAPYPYPYPYPAYTPAPVYSGPLHPQIGPQAPPWITSIPLGTTYSYPVPRYPVPSCPHHHSHSHDCDKRDWSRGSDYRDYSREKQSSRMSVSYGSRGLSVSGSVSNTQVRQENR